MGLPGSPLQLAAVGNAAFSTSSHTAHSGLCSISRPWSRLVQSACLQSHCCCPPCTAFACCTIHLHELQVLIMATKQMLLPPAYSTCLFRLASASDPSAVATCKTAVARLNAQHVLVLLFVCLNYRRCFPSSAYFHVVQACLYCRCVQHWQSSTHCCQCPSN